MPAALRFEDLDRHRDDYATRVVERILAAAFAAGASDVHFELTRDQVSVKWRVAGYLQPIAEIADGSSTKILGRIKALARLVTYRHDIPQEGRLALSTDAVEARVGTLPTLHGERAVIRLVAKSTRDWRLEQLGLPEAARLCLESGLNRASGVILISGIPGAGKTTTAYAALRELLAQPQAARSVVSLEDPIEAEIAGVSQSQINPGVGYDWSSGLKALLRQDPEVLLVGEIREPETASVVFQAALTGQLVITTMHARTAADGIRRLLDMLVPAHLLLSGLNSVICQRLVGRVCATCRGSGRAGAAEGHSGEICATCDGSGRCGRMLLAEALPAIDGELARAVLQDADARHMQQVALGLGMRGLSSLAEEALAAGQMSPGDRRRYFIE